MFTSKPIGLPFDGAVPPIVVHGIATSKVYPPVEDGIA